jgi:drug/metabolite transporter (DMT)-like permease
MHSSRSSRVTTHLLLALTVVFNSLGNVLLSEGMKRNGNLNAWRPGEALRFFTRALGSGTIWLGIGVLLLFFVVYLVVLSRADYSYVSPASAAGYAVVALLGYTVLGEPVTPVRWAGIALICAGVALVGRTPPRTAKEGR